MGAFLFWVRRRSEFIPVKCILSLRNKRLTNKGFPENWSSGYLHPS
ncbi:unnamed protein product [Larinioides sclopetarius]|uniref:Uncharacterized protein n=1 Tax=Larinioides sclopetarius TaxID=280406 RepID=A0AAV2APF0_9ARAC